MSQDYLHACERAELLGLPKPSEEEWRQTVRSENRCDEDDNDALQVIALYNLLGVACADISMYIARVRAMCSQLNK